jgi:hypothetical protein
LNVRIKCFWIGTPQAMQAASKKEYGGPYSGPVI